MQEETTATGASAQTGRESTFGTLLSDAQASETLAEFGFKTPLALHIKLLPLLKASRDTVLIEKGITDSTESYAPALIFEREIAKGKGTTIIIAPQKKAVDIVKSLKKFSIEAKPILGASDEDTVFVGTPEETTQFFGGELAGKIMVGRILIHDLVEEDVDLIKQALGAGVKRGRRPHLMLLANQENEATKSIITEYFPSLVNQAQHTYFEVDADLLTKVNFVCDYIEAEGRPKTLIFCNQPSDTDLVDVMLKRKGIPARKLIGNVPSMKVNQTLNELTAGELTALIVTDISARSIDIGLFDLLINYSIPSDPEVYLHRTETSGSNSRVKQILSLVGPLDKANFHYLRKIVETEFAEATPPSSETLSKARLDNLVNTAKQANVTDANLKSLVESILNHEEKELIVTYLLHAAQNSSSNSEGRRGGRDRDNFRNEGRDDFRRGRGRDRRGQRDDGDYEQSNEDSDDSSRGFDKRNNRRNERLPLTPPERISRLYVGTGKNAGMTDEQLMELIKSGEVEIPESALKRISLRENYAFVDVADEVTEEISNRISKGNKKSGNIFVKRAISLNIARAEAAETEEDNLPSDETTHDLGGDDEALVAQE